jgi:hypothetical protein
MLFEGGALSEPHAMLFFISTLIFYIIGKKIYSLGIAGNAVTGDGFNRRKSDVADLSEILTLLYL